MVNIVLNETEYVERMLEQHTVEGNSVLQLKRIAKYYYAKGFKKSEIEQNLIMYMVRCDPNVNIVKWQDTIETIARTASKYPLVNIEFVGITKSELDAIDKAGNRTKKKLLFTMLCLAKYCNAVRPHNNNWVNYRDSDIFSLANISMTVYGQSILLNDLWNDGYIEFSKMVNNTNIAIKFIDDNSPVVLKITDFRNLGNQYLRYTGEKYFECQCCGRVIRKKSNAQKYCKDCASEINAKKTLESYHLKLPS